MTDVAGLASTEEADAYRGVRNALSATPCARSELISSRLPTDYVANLETAVNHQDRLVIAASFLLTDAVLEVARANPTAHFLLVDPLIVPPAAGNLLVLTLRRDQGAFLAGALGAMLSRNGVIAGVYGPGADGDQLERSAFERGAASIDPAIRVLGAYQPSTGPPYDDPAWGASQARAFSGEGADVIFGSGGRTGQGALAGASQAGRPCIADQMPKPPPACVVAAIRTSIERALERAMQNAIGAWQPGVMALGLHDNVIGLDLLGSADTPEIQGRLRTLAQQPGI